jgi:hypothetical protein
MKYFIWFDSSGIVNLVNIPETIVEKCSHAGECYADCLESLPELDWANFNPRETLEALKTYSDWVDYMDKENLTEADIQELKIKILWIACIEIKENPSLYLKEDNVSFLS